MNTSDPIQPPFNEFCDENRLQKEIGQAEAPQRFAQPGAEGRLVPTLREAARTHDAREILIRSAVMLYAARHRGKVPALPTADEALANALADLAVTGRAAWNSFRVQAPNEKTLVPEVTQRLAQLHSSASSADVASAVSAALDRAYSVALALRGPYPQTSERSALGWIAVSGEDDPPHRPVNVGSPPYPQYEIPVTVGGVSLQTRFIVASPPSPQQPNTSAARPASEPLRTKEMFTVSAPPPRMAPPGMLSVPRISVPVVSQGGSPADKSPERAKRSIPSEAVPVVPQGNQVILFIHGHSSSAEEALDIIPSLHEEGQKRGTRYSIVSLDLPCSGYSTMFDHTKVSGLESDKTTFPGGIFDHGPIRTPVLDFIENFIVAFVDALDRVTPIKSRFAGIIGGSLGGNMGLRLGRRDLNTHPWLKSGIVSWDPASVWTPMVQDEVKRHAPEHCREKWNEPELDSSRVNYFKEVFDGEIYDAQGKRHEFQEAVSSILMGATQPQMWYRDNWGNGTCKALHIRQCRASRHEIYNEGFRRWHWRVAGEQLIFSHLDRVEHGNGRTPLRYELNHARQLLAAGERDNYRFSNIYDATRQLAHLMKNTPGRSLFLRETGHSIHVERPRFFAGEIVKFLHG